MLEILPKMSFLIHADLEPVLMQQTKLHEARKLVKTVTMVAKAKAELGVEKQAGIFVGSQLHCCKGTLGSRKGAQHRHHYHKSSCNHDFQLFEWSAMCE
jgi:hypothetical protein